jgi:CheY-like chemotaxis protein
MTALSSVRILAVDDDVDSLEMVAFVLRAQEAVVTLATSADEALEFFLQRPFDLLVSDIAMPGRDGIWLIRQIRSMPASYGGKVPAVALTAHASETTLEAVLSAGYQVRIAKPADPTALVAQLRALVDA